MHPYRSNYSIVALKKSRFILLDRSYFHMFDNQSISAHAFAFLVQFVGLIQYSLLLKGCIIFISLYLFFFAAFVIGIFFTIGINLLLFWFYRRGSKYSVSIPCSKVTPPLKKRKMKKTKKQKNILRMTLIWIKGFRECGVPLRYHES